MFLDLFLLFFKGWMNLGIVLKLFYKNIYGGNIKGTFVLPFLALFLFGHTWETYLKVFSAHFEIFGDVLGLW
jgi:hypothetical protein